MRALGYLMLTVALLWTAVPCSAADFEAQAGLDYRAWTSDAHESGAQFYLPVHLRSTIRQLSCDIVAGYASTTGDLAGDGDHSISGPLDTQLNLAYELPHAAGFDWLLGLDVNLPTGKTDEDPRDLKIMLDPDLVSVVSPGQGLNFNPFVNLARRWNAWTFGIGAGYAFQGKYDYSTDHRDYDPGDIFNAAAEAAYDWGNGWQTRLFGQYATFGTDTESGKDLLKRGDILLMGAGVQFQHDPYTLGLTLQAISRAKSEFRQSASTAISTEDHDSNGDEWLAKLNGQYSLSAATTVSAAVSYMDVEANEYDKSSAFFVGRRTKTDLALDLNHELSDRLSLQCGLEGFVMEDDPNWLHPNEDRTYHGWVISLTVNNRF
jgi:hypothetical protein